MDPIDARATDLAEVDIEVVEEPASEAAMPAVQIERETVEFRRATEIASAVMSSELLLRLRSNALTELSRSAVVVDHDPGEIVFESGAAADAVYIVTRGTLRVWVDKQAVFTAETGSLLGPESIVGSGQYASTARAATRCTLLRLHVATLAQLDSTAPGLLDAFRSEASHLLKAVYLAAHPIAARCGRDGLRELQDASEIRRVRANEVLVAQGERPTGLMFIVDGDFKAIQSTGGAAHLTGELAVGDLANVALVVSGGVSPQSIESRSDGWIIFTPRGTVAALITEHPMLLESMMGF